MTKKIAHLGCLGAPSNASAIDVRGQDNLQSKQMFMRSCQRPHKHAQVSWTSHPHAAGFQKVFACASVVGDGII